MRSIFSISRFGLILAVAMIAVACNRNKYELPPGPPPSTLPVLRLMPDSASMAFGIPPADRVGDKMIEVVRAAIPAEAQEWANGFLDEIEMQLRAEDGQQGFSKAMASVGWATDAPVGIYLRNAPDAESMPTVAITFTASDPEMVQGWLDGLEDLMSNSGDGDGRSNGAAPPPLFLLHGNRVIAGTDGAFVAEIAARIDTPRSLDYGTAKCPSFTADAFTALVRLDQPNNALKSVFNAFAESQGLSDLLAGHFPDTTQVFTSDPVLVTFEWGPDSIELAARADLIEHAGLRKALGRPTPVRLAKAAPASTIGIASFRFNEDSKALVMDIFSRTFAQGDEGGFASEFPITDTMGQWIQFVDDELSIAITGFDDDGPRGVGMLALRNRGSLSQLLLTLPAPGQTVETYRRVEIKRVPENDLYYATARNTIVIGNNLDEVRETVVHLVEKTVSSAFDQFQPSVALDAPQYMTLYARSEAVSEVISTFLNVPEWSLVLLDGAEAIVRDVRVTGGVTGEWLDTRLKVHFGQAPAALSSDGQRERQRITSP